MLDTDGFSGHYDFVCVPADLQRKQGRGYAFVNFVSTADAQCFKERFTGFDCWTVVSNKVCEVCWGDEQVQGLAAHIERYRNSNVMHDDVPDVFKPAIFANGVRAKFPPPTKRIRPPAGMRPTVSPSLESQ